MIEADKCVLVLLAAGRSERFGEADKLREDYLGQPLAYHVLTALEAVQFKARIAVTSNTDLDFASKGYRVVCNARPEEGMSGSVKIGVAAARGLGAEAVVFALADMPRVTATHIHRLLDAADSADAVVASSNGVHPCPPAVFGAAQFEALMMLEGDEGARAMVRAGRHVIAPDTELIDVDCPEDLDRLRGLR